MRHYGTGIDRTQIRNIAGRMEMTSAPAKKEKNPSHYRYFIEQIRQDYEAGILTAKGAVLMAVRILRRPGHKLRISSMEEFSGLIGPGTRACYIAISKLRSEGMLEWKDIGGIDVWVPIASTLAERRIGGSGNNDQTITDSDRSITDSDRLIAASDQTITTTIPKPLTSKASRTPPRYLSSSSSNFSQREREVVENSPEEEPIEQEQSISSTVPAMPLLSPNCSGESSGQDKYSVTSPLDENFDWSKFVAPGVEQGFPPEFFQFVVGKANKFINPVPADPPSAAESWIRKQGHVLFPSWLNSRSKPEGQEPFHREEMPGSNGSFQEYRPEAMPPSAAEIFENQKRRFGVLVENECFEDAQEFLNTILRNQGRPGVDRLLEHFPYCGMSIVNNHVWRTESEDTMAMEEFQIAV